MVQNLLVTIFHLCVFSINVYGLHYDLNSLKHTRKSYGGRWKFLTFWCEILNTLYFGLALLNDIISLLRSRSCSNVQKKWSLRKLNDIFVTTIVFPLSMIVVIVFWLIYNIDRELIFPASIAAIIPMWLNHIMHTLPMPALLLEKLLVHHYYVSLKQGSCIISLVGLSYTVWVYWIHYVSTLWVYPFLAVFSNRDRLLFFSGLILCSTGLFSLGRCLTSYLHQKAAVSQRSEGKEDIRNKRHPVKLIKYY